MKRNKISFVLWILLLILSDSAFSQDRYEVLKSNLEKISQTTPALNEKVNVSVSGVSIQEFIRAIANNAGLNINVDPSLQIDVINNFSEVRVLDMIVFLSKEYNLEVKTIGNIISISPFKEKPLPIAAYVPKKLKIFANQELISVDLENDSLYMVARAITNVTGKNIILGATVRNRLVNGYIQDSDLEPLLDKLAFANDLTFGKTDDGFYVLDMPEVIELGNRNTTSTNKNGRGSEKTGQSNNDPSLSVKVYSQDSIQINAVNTPVGDIIKTVSQELGKQYSFLSEIDKNVTLFANGLSYDDLLFFLLNGTDYTFKRSDDIYLIGENKLKEMRSFRVIELQYRTVEKLKDVIPAELSKDLEIKEFIDLNSLLVTGPLVQIREIEEFIRQVDKVIPVILIEVIIVDINRNFSYSLGVDAGLGDNPRVSKKLHPGVDYSFDSHAINDLLNSFSGFGSFNLGQVTPEFYLNLKALETNQIIKLRSTPKLSTLNGTEASIKLSQTAYYVKENVNVSGSLTSQTIQTRSFESVTADFNVKIKPIVSADEYITLDIQVTQSDFTGRSSDIEGAPPGQYTRDFKSQIRVKNQEMVLLGGLEDKKSDESGTGVPFLARVPIIKWFFSSRTRTKSTSKLSIFIKPTVIY